MSLHLEAGSPNREVLEKHYSSFYASDAVLARVLAMALSQSQVGSFIETEERIELVFGMAAVLAYPVLCCKKILAHVTCMSKNKGTSLWKFSPNSGLLENFAVAYRSSKRVIINLARHKWALRVINWTVVGRLS